MFQPLHGLVTIVLDKKDPKTEGGLHLPDTFAGVFLTGTIRAVGLGSVDKTMGRPMLLPGDKVLIAQHVQVGPQGRKVQAYPTIMDNGVECILCDHSEVMGVIK
jgi:co-chaperonin GroES (HSP10)